MQIVANGSIKDVFTKENLDKTYQHNKLALLKEEDYV